VQIQYKATKGGNVFMSCLFYLGKKWAAIFLEFKLSEQSFFHDNNNKKIETNISNTHISFLNCTKINYFNKAILQMDI